MTALSLISFFLTILALLFSLLSQLHLWQRKEYRWDRLRASLAEQSVSWTYALLWIASTLSLLSWLLNQTWLALGAILCFLVVYISRTLVIGIYRPRWTAKAITIGVLEATMLFVLISLILIKDSSVTSLALLLTIIPPLTFISVGLANIITSPLKNRTIARAARLRQSLPSLQVIGITGSYGKTTTKHLLSQLIPSAVVSLHHRNSPYIIALDMLQQLKKNTSTYIVELSAYRPGEIRELTNLTRPTVGVLTHLGNQHLALFGSFDRLVRTKWELISNLPSHGMAVLNADDPAQVKQAATFHRSIHWYSILSPSDVYADQISYFPDKFNFRLHLSGASYSVSVPLLSEAYLSSALAAICTADALGIPAADIINNLSKLTAYPQTMELLPGINGCQVIDDSYSANEQSVLNAINHLRRFPQTDHRIITVPLMELGSDASQVHQRLGRAMKDSGAQVFIYGRNHIRHLKQPSFTDPAQIIKLATQNVSPNTVFLLEGRIPEIIRRSILKS